MTRARCKKEEEIRCSACGEPVPSYDLFICGSSEGPDRNLCSQCYNREMAELDGLEGFESTRLAPMSLSDCDGNCHEFVFRTHLFGPGVSLAAFELRDGEPAGHEFWIHGDPEEDLLELLARLIDKIRRALSLKHLEKGRSGLEIADRTVRGRIARDRAEEGRVPALVIDGKDITWEDFGRMLMTFEGFQFKLEICDKSEEF